MHVRPLQPMINNPKFYPAYRYHRDGTLRRVMSVEEDAALGEGWYDHPLKASAAAREPVMVDAPAKLAPAASSAAATPEPAPAAPPAPDSVPDHKPKRKK